MSERANCANCALLPVQPLSGDLDGRPLRQCGLQLPTHGFRLGVRVDRRHGKTTGRVCGTLPARAPSARCGSRDRHYRPGGSWRRYAGGTWGQSLRPTRRMQRSAQNRYRSSPWTPPPCRAKLSVQSAFGLLAKASHPASTPAADNAGLARVRGGYGGPRPAESQFRRRNHGGERPARWTCCRPLPAVRRSEREPAGLPARFAF